MAIRRPQSKFSEAHWACYLGNPGLRTLSVLRGPWSPARRVVWPLDPRRPPAPDQEGGQNIL